jgi:hypothetical protein
MPLRIGFDMDGVVADLNAALLREARVLFPELDLRTAGRAHPELAPAGPADGDRAGTDPAEIVPPSLRLTPRQQRQLWDAVRSTTNFWETLDETEPGIVARIADTVRTRRWEIIFLTSRPSSAGDIVQVQSQRWLHSHGFEYPSIFVVSTSRGRIASALELDVVVDDRPENCLDIAIDSKARAVLIWRGDQGAVPGSARRLGIGGVASVGACLDLLVEADSPGADETSLVDRLKRLLRLKTSEPERARA